MVHAAAIMGLKAAVVLDSASDRGLAVILESAPVETSRLVSAITNRQCTRAEYDGKSVSADDLRRLEAAGTMDGADCLLLTDRARMDRVLDYVVQGNSVQMNDCLVVDKEAVHRALAEAGIAPVLGPFLDFRDPGATA